MVRETPMENVALQATFSLLKRGRLEGLSCRSRTNDIGISESGISGFRWGAALAPRGLAARKPDSGGSTAARKTRIENPKQAASPPAENPKSRKRGGAAPDAGSQLCKDFGVCRSTTRCGDDPITHAPKAERAITRMESARPRRGCERGCAGLRSGSWEPSFHAFSVTMAGDSRSDSDGMPERMSNSRTLTKYTLCPR